MELQDERQLENTRVKLQALKEIYDDAWKNRGGKKAARQAELESLLRLINQLIEEIVRFECRNRIRTTRIRY